jgi:hypothetical protein
MIKGQTVTFRQGDTGNTILTGTITRVWEKPAADPYVTILASGGRTFIRCSSHVTAAEDFTTAYAKHVAYFQAKLGTAAADPCICGEPLGDHFEMFGPGYVSDVCRCGHERGSHWDGEGTCDPTECGCRIFRDQRA